MECFGEGYIDSNRYKKKSFSFDTFWDRTTDILLLILLFLLTIALFIVVFALCVALLS